jgi:hypothetical protein
VTLHKFSGNEIKTVEKNCKNFETENSGTDADAETSTSRSEPATAIEPVPPQPFPRSLLHGLGPVD